MMAIKTNDAELLASLRMLACVAQADGTANKQEISLLEASLEGAPLPAGVTIQSLLGEPCDPEKQMILLTSPEAREQAFHAAFAVANADGQCSAGEQKILDRMRASWNLPEEQTTLLGRLFHEVKDTVLPGNIQAISDAGKRKTEIQSDTLKYSVLCGALGAFPIPGISIGTDLAVVGVQAKFVRDIGQRWGHTVDAKAAKSILYGLGLGTGMRIAVNSLFKLVPVAGSVWGASTAFASTWALGKIADQYFESGAKSDIATYQKAFNEAKVAGQAAYKTNQAAVEAAGKKHAEALKALGEELKSGKLDPENYERKITELSTTAPALAAKQAV